MAESGDPGAEREAAASAGERAESPPSLDRDAILAVGETLAREAGAVLMQHFGRLDPAEIKTKSAARDLVTAADIESERTIVRGLRAAFPAHAI